MAITGGVLAILILWFFLRNIRLVAIIAVSIPVSVYSAFNFFYAADISINSLTLVGMALAIGMLVDNSVVVLENIYRLASQGKDPETAVKQGTLEVWRSVFASTLTTLIVFMPFIFANNYMIKDNRQKHWSIHHLHADSIASDCLAFHPDGNVFSDDKKFRNKFGNFQETLYS